jgi:flagellar biosynthesis protein FlhG
LEQFIMNEASRKAHTIAVTSGKGGVGKTFLRANIAAALARAGRRVLVIDADLGLANLDIILNLQPKSTLHDVLNGVVELEDVILTAPCGFSVLPAGSGIAEYARLSGELRERMRMLLDRLGSRYDCLLIDTGAGITDLVQYAASLADELVVVTTPEPTALADAYATIKVLSADCHRSRVHLVINQVRRPGEGVTLTKQLQQVVDRFLTSAEAPPPQLGFLGEIPHDADVPAAVRSRRLLLESSPGSPVSLAITGIAGRLSRQLLASAA